jgi:hypothetical protein
MNIEYFKSLLFMNKEYLISEICDLHQALNAVPVKRVDSNEHLTFEEFCEGEILINPPTRDTWVESLKSKTGMKVVALLSDPPTTIGVFDWDVAVQNENKIEIHNYRVWIVAVVD